MPLSETKDMERRVMNALNGIGEWYGPEVRDILYTHGKFRGYVFYKEAMPEQEMITADTVSHEITNTGPYIYNNPVVDNPSVNRGSAQRSYNTTARAIYLIASVILMGVVTAKAIYPSMLQMSYLRGSDMGSIFSTVSIYGFLGIGVGAIVSCICGKFLFSKSAVLYYVCVPVVFIISATLLYLLLQMVIGLASVVIEILVSLIPIAVVIVCIASVIKGIFK